MVQRLVGAVTYEKVMKAMDKMKPENQLDPEK